MSSHIYTKASWILIPLKLVGKVLVLSHLHLEEQEKGRGLAIAMGREIIIFSRERGEFFVLSLLMIVTGFECTYVLN